jgi:hypothetical protein
MLAGGERGEKFLIPGKRVLSPFPLFPSSPRSCEKIQAAGKWGARVCPGKGQIHAAKTGAGFFVAVVVFNPLKSKNNQFVFIKNIRMLPASLGGSWGSASRSSITRRVLAA